MRNAVRFFFLFSSSSSLILLVVAFRYAAVSSGGESQCIPSFHFPAAVLTRQCVCRIASVVAFGKSLLVDRGYSGLNVSSIALVVDSETIRSIPVRTPSSSLVRAYGKVLVLVPVFQFTHCTSS